MAEQIKRTKKILSKGDVCVVVDGQDRHGIEVGAQVVVLKKEGKSSPYHVAYGDTPEHVAQMKGRELDKFDSIKV